MDPKEMISGAFGAVCCISAGQPFDVIKARLQSQVVEKGVPRAGAFNLAVDTVKGEGLGALFKGFSPALSSAMIENMVVWTVNSFLRERLERRLDDELEIGRGQHAFLGACTGVVSAFCICPSEVIKVRQQTRKTKHSPLVVLQEILKQKGPRGLFFGLVPLLMRDVPFYFVFFGAMESYFAFVNPKEDSLFHSAIGGGLAGSLAWAVVFPLDVIKTRAQVFGTTGNVFLALRNVVKKEGMSGIYRGWYPAVLRGFPANGSLVLGVHSARLVLDNPIFDSHSSR